MANKTRRWGKWEADEAAFARGGQGHVYRVRDTTGEHVGQFVLKELLNPKRSERFTNEIKAITTLSGHAYVIDVVDFGAYKDPLKPTYVMPEADCSLESYIHERKGEVSALDCLGLFRKIVSGVEHLHSSGIIHRDIKPDNILMFSGEPKVSDFGLCLITDLPRMTATEEAVGPRYYMAPELEDGRYLEVNSSADIYSLGKVLYFLLSGGNVFSREKFNLPHWNLALIKGDERFQIFNEIFRKTIVEPVYRRATSSELEAEILEAQEKYLAHPLSTLERKSPGILSSYDGTTKELSNLSELEWVELLKLRKKHSAPWSASIVEVALKAITKETAEMFAHELFRFRDLVDIEQLRLLAAKLMSATDGAVMHWSNLDHFVDLAVDAKGPAGINAVAKIFNLRKPDVLGKIALRVKELELESLVSFLMSSSSFSYSGRESALLEVSRCSREPNVLGFAIAGLMHEGSDVAIERVAEIFRGLTSLKKLPEAIQGIALSRESQINISKLLARGGYNDDIARSLRIMSDISKEVIQDMENKETRESFSAED